MDYYTHWLLTVFGFSVLLLCGFAIRFFRTRRSHTQPR